MQLITKAKQTNTCMTVASMGVTAFLVLHECEFVCITEDEIVKCSW